ncbi:beta-ketoacyl synthase N-terminal-like domain-containing protein [Streptomyces sp. NPDC007904]|uniref:beta-ketoacyl [acyl carrier protein] synthase domain-containing protein n=1 Tax=Streptomyces sp. NPDC007904 TaxID=3364787 RepID=UPI0036E08838
MSAPADTPIAVIGMSCRTSGAETLTEFWDLASRAERRLHDVPADRWYGLDEQVAATNSPAAFLLDSVDGFDARFFGIAPRMAAFMDPQHRLMLELAWHAVENAGLDPESLAGEPVAVFAGAFMSDYGERMIARGKRADGAAFPGTMMAFLANRVSYQFGWTGPSMVIDSACSAGLSALGFAVQGLRAGDYPMALVGSPNLFSAGYYTTNAYLGGALSPTGDSVPFSASRNGYLRGEGGACLLLKPLDAALADGDPVHAVIRSVGSAHNGRGGGLTGTDQESQIALVRRTLAAAGLTPRDLGHLEAHGTGTRGGDATEIAALARLLPGAEGPAAGPDGKLWVGSVKANIGHLEGAAGLIGIVKTVLALQAGTIPRIAGLDAADESLPVGDSPLGLPVENLPWPAGDVPRVGAVNAFGLGGSLSHAVVEEAPRRAVAAREQAAEEIVPLSAGSDAAVALLARRLLRAYEGTDAPALDSLAWTLQHGRRDMKHRRALVVSGTESLRTALTAVAEGRHRPPADAVARAWEDGGAPQWDTLWKDRERPPRAHLPGTPFQRRSCWFDDEAPAAL